MFHHFRSGLPNSGLEFVETHNHTHKYKNLESMWIEKEFECWEIKTANFASVGISGGKNMYIKAIIYVENVVVTQFSEWKKNIL